MRFLQKLYYGPPDWVVENISARARRAFWFWVTIVSVLLAFWLASFVWYVTVLSIIALAGSFAAETPVEDESESE